jgi:hypothetical protein
MLMMQDRAQYFGSAHVLELFFNLAIIDNDCGYRGVRCRRKNGGRRERGGGWEEE